MSPHPSNPRSLHDQEYVTDGKRVAADRPGGDAEEVVAEVVLVVLLEKTEAALRMRNFKAETVTTIRYLGLPTQLFLCSHRKLVAVLKTAVQ